MSGVGVAASATYQAISPKTRSRVKLKNHQTHSRKPAALLIMPISFITNYLPGFLFVTLWAIRHTIGPNDHLKIGALFYWKRGRGCRQCIKFWFLRTKNFIFNSPRQISVAVDG